jgi:hypothetical protein
LRTQLRVLGGPTLTCRFLSVAACAAMAPDDDLRAAVLSGNVEKARAALDGGANVECTLVMPMPGAPPPVRRGAKPCDGLGDRLGGAHARWCVAPPRGGYERRSRSPWRKVIWKLWSSS